jgi:hypothetical protein
MDWLELTYRDSYRLLATVKLTDKKVVIKADIVYLSNEWIQLDGQFALSISGDNVFVYCVHWMAPISRAFGPKQKPSIGHCKQLFRLQ